MSSTPPSDDIPPASADELPREASRAAFSSHWPAFAVAAACVVTTALLLWWLPLPLGVQGEWTWLRLPFSTEIAMTWIAGLAAFATFFVVVWKGESSLAVRPSLGRQCGWLLLLLAGSAVWWNAILLSLPQTFGYGRAPFVLYYARSSGYFLQARQEADDLRGFLHSYESLLSEEDYLHIGTHPPGLTAGLRLLLDSCRSSETLTAALLACEPAAVRESIREIRSNLADRGIELDDADEACLWGAALLVEVVFLMGALFLYGLVRMEAPAHVAWHVAALWPLVPGAIVFFPKSDLLFPTIGLACAWFWLRGLRSRSAWSSAVSGLIAWIGMMLSLALAPVLVLLAVATLCLRPWRIADAAASGAVPAADLSRLLVPIGWGTAGFLVPTLALWGWSGLNLFAVWNWNLHNHALFYEHNSRTWWAWTLVNPLEFAMTLGLPVSIFAISGAWRTVRREPASTARNLLVAWCLVLAALLLTGKNMGEAARLWLVFTPWPMLTLAAALLPPATAGQRFDPSRPTWLALLTAQAACCLLTATRIDGFHFAELLAS